MKIGFFSKELSGLHKNGGIGTANANLATLLATRHSIDFIYCNVDAKGPRVAEGTFEKWSAHYADINISLSALDFTEHGARNTSYDVWNKIKHSNYDVVIFDDYGGLGFYTVCAKQSGLTDVKIVTILHSPNDWLRNANKMPPLSFEEIVECSIERHAVEHSDMVLHPSQFLKTWLENYGWNFPANTRHLNLYINTGAARDRSPFPAGEIVRPGAIVFFGRLEERKGIDIFLRAIISLETELKGIKVIFCGKPGHIQGKNAMFEILNRIKNRSIDFTFMHNLDSEQSMAMMKAERAIAVMPSPEDNSPCVVYECLQANLPFIASSNTGAVELVDAQSMGDAFVEPEAVALRERLRRVLKDGYRYPRPTYDRRQVAELYLNAFDEFEVSRRPISKATELRNPLVTICVTHHNQSKLLVQELKSLELQSYTNFEVIVIDDGSTNARDLAGFDLIEKEYEKDARFKFFKTENQYLGAARNVAIRKAKGEYVVFCDDDNVQFPEMVETLLAAILHSGADIAIPLSSPLFSSIEPSKSDIVRPGWLPIGPAGKDASLANNCFGDANSMFRRSLFDEIGFLDEEYGFTAQDWQMFARAAFAGKKLILVPEQLSFYRVRQDSMFRTSSAVRNYMPVLKEYLKADAREIRNSLFMLINREHHAEIGTNVADFDKIYGIPGLREATYDLDSSNSSNIGIMMRFASSLGLDDVFPPGIITNNWKIGIADRAGKQITVIFPADVSSLIDRYSDKTVDGYHIAVGRMSNNSVVLHALKGSANYNLLKTELAPADTHEVCAIFYPDVHSAGTILYTLGNAGTGLKKLEGKTRGTLKFDRSKALECQIDGMDSVANSKLYAIFVGRVMQENSDYSTNGERLESLFLFNGNNSIATKKYDDEHWKADGYWGGLFFHPTVNAPSELLVKSLPSRARRVRFMISCSSSMPDVTLLIRDETLEKILFVWEIDGSYDGSFIEIDTSNVDSSRIHILFDAISGSHAYCGITLDHFMVA